MRKRTAAKQSSFCEKRLFSDHFGIGQHEGADALGVVADDGFAEVVGEGAVAVVLAAEAGDEADAAQLQAAVRVQQYCKSYR